MLTFYRLLSSKFGRGLRLVGGAALIGLVVLRDSYGNLVWLLLIPGMVMILGALLNINLTAAFFGLPVIGYELKKETPLPDQPSSPLSQLTYVGDNLRRHSLPRNHN